MRIHTYVSATVALIVAGAPLRAQAGAVVTASVSSAGEVAAGATVGLTCFAEGQPTGGMSSSTTRIDGIDVAVSGGTVSPATLTGATSGPCSFDAAQTCSILQGQVSWVTPATAGALTATCTASYTTTPRFGSPTTGTVAGSAELTTVESTVLPPVVGEVTGAAVVLVGGTAAFEVSATDPGGLALTYGWTATGGAFTSGATTAAATWQAPEQPGSYVVTATVTNAGGASVTATKTVSVVLAQYRGTLPVPVTAPRRLAADATHGGLLVVDSHAEPAGSVTLVTVSGEYRGAALIGEDALAVTEGGGSGWATTTRGRLFKFDPVSGRSLGQVPVSPPLSSAYGMAYDAVNGRIWITEFGGSVRIVRPDGTTYATLTAAGAGTLVSAVDVAIDAANGRAWVLLQEPNESGLFVHEYDLTGAWVASYVGRGTAGPVSRGGGIAVSAGGRVYVSDAFQGRVQVYEPDGTFVGTVGTFGENPGELFTPLGMAFMANGDLLVTDVTFGRVSRFGDDTPAPACVGDTDCDGLPDTWEDGHGLDKASAADALRDDDGDGLTNLEEYAAGTDPWNADTDGDGASDREELLAGLDPLDPRDHGPVVVATGPGTVDPGHVKLSSTVSGEGTCTVSWRQVPVAGVPAVTLRGADGATASFVARQAATYEFEATGRCGTVPGMPAPVSVTVRNVAPRAEAGRVLVTAPGTPIRLDAFASSDANGDALTTTWDQTLGSALVGTESGAALSARPRGVGLYAFQVTASDGVAESTSEVPVLVTAGPAPTAVASASPAEAQAGTTVVLDASASFVEGGGGYAWTQVGGPAVALTGPGEATASFVPQAAGRHVFEVTVARGQLRSPPARVEVFVTEAGQALPSVTASTATPVVAVNDLVTLEATASGSVSYAWRQVSGPAAGLAEPEQASATVVPFAPGYYAFEVTATDGAAESRPARVGFEARAGGAANPVAVATLPQPDAVTGQLVFLDGRGSTGATRYRWTQVAGPWVPLPQQALTWFRPTVPGVYAFELEVDDRTVRSAPARVEVNVVEGAVP